MDMQDYYGKRAKEYEASYYRDDPSRQKEQKLIANALQKALAGKDVLEIACGTGYWTQFVSETAAKITATDIREEVLTIAKTTKQYTCPIKFTIADAFQLPFEKEQFSGGLANFWFSHLKKSERIRFLTEFHRVLQSNAHVFFADNVYNENVGGKLVKRANEEDTYKLRTLQDGSESLIIKNYPTQEELTKIFQPFATNLAIHFGKHFWFLSYRLSKQKD